MNVATQEIRPSSAWSPHRWTTAQYDSMLASGLLKEGSKTFLWAGEIIEPMPENPPHFHAQDNLQRRLIARLPEDEWTITPAHPLALRDGYKPQPDMVVLSGPRSSYRNRVPRAIDAALVVEVSDTTYFEDSGDKLPEYAAAGIPQYWIVHIRARRIETYSAPLVRAGVGSYANRVDYSIGEAVPLVLARQAETCGYGPIPVLDILKDSLEEG